MHNIHPFGSALYFALFVSFAVGCGDDDDRGRGSEGCSVEEQTGCADGLECQLLADGGTDCFCSVDRQVGCEDGLSCQPVVDGNSACFEPVIVGGKVFDLSTGEAIEGAHVVARDVNNAAVSGVSVSDEDGYYELAVPTAHNENGTLASYEVFLRADAADFVTFPSWPRVALPIDVGAATGDPPLLETPSTDIGLLAIPNPAGLGSVSGTVHADSPRGTLVVAGRDGQGGAPTGIADHDGFYTVFNVPAGSVTVRGYKAGLQLDSETADVEDGETVEDVDLEAAGDATATVSGKVEIVNPGDGDDTSIILVVEETFNPAVASGEAPPGLRIGNIGGDFSIANVPDGKYVVLAAFENDFLVRDPDTSIGGTDLVHVTVSGSAVELDSSFKITGSLDDVSPDGEEEVSGTPTFVWADDSGEDHYEVVVFDAFGNQVWEKSDVPGVSGDKHVRVQYGGPPLESGLLYQFRATSIKNSGAPLARTEDLRGVFLYR